MARGVISFIEATLGFEADAIKKATDTLHDAEQAASKEHQRAVRHGVSASSSFPPGLEYSVVHAEAQLLGAVTLFLSESVIDSAKALYKLRKAYQTLEEVSKQISNSKQRVSLSAKFSSPSLESQQNLAKQKPNPTSSYKSEKAAECVTGLTSKILENPEVSAKARKYFRARLERLKELSETDPESQIDEAILEAESFENSHKSVGEDTVDEYITSAINACYGILKLLISVIPPGIGRVLSMVGFHGTENDGLTLLWKATSQINVHGAIALLALLQFYDGPTQANDIELPEAPEFSSEASSETLTIENNDKFCVPDLENLRDVKKKLKATLNAATKHYPRGALWQLQEGRMKAAEGDLVEAVNIMSDTSRGPINLRQVEGLMLFDKTMYMISLHDYENSSSNFLKLIDLNSWSHMFYTYLSAICEVETYRAHKKDNPEKAKAAKHAAEKLLEVAPSHLARKKVLSKPMPFDRFGSRKMSQWREIAELKNISIVDAIGTSPIHEIVYFWNGYGHMPHEDLELSLKLLGYTAQGSLFSFSTPESVIVNETEDELLIRFLLQSVVLRHLGRVQEGFDLLKTQVLPKLYQEAPSKGHFKSGLPKVVFSRNHRDAWVTPSAIYEMAVFTWKLKGREEISLVRDYLELAGSWGDDYELSTRVGLKIKSVMSRLDKL